MRRASPGRFDICQLLVNTRGCTWMSRRWRARAADRRRDSELDVAQVDAAVAYRLTPGIGPGVGLVEGEHGVGLAFFGARQASQQRLECAKRMVKAGASRVSRWPLCINSSLPSLPLRQIQRSAGSLMRAPEMPANDLRPATSAHRTRTRRAPMPTTTCSWHVAIRFLTDTSGRRFQPVLKMLVHALTGQRRVAR